MGHLGGKVNGINDTPIDSTYFRHSNISPTLDISTVNSRSVQTDKIIHTHLDTEYSTKNVNKEAKGKCNTLQSENCTIKRLNCIYYRHYKLGNIK